MTTLAVGATSVDLPDDFLWSDEFAWTPVVKTEEFSLTGARIVQNGVRLSGRPITLEPEGDDSAWVTRAAVEQIAAWAALPGTEMTLTFRGVPRVVEFRSNETPFAARPVAHFSDAQPGDFYLLTLRLTEK